MKFVGLYNFKGAGTEVITGNGNENIASSKDVVSNDPKIFFSGQITNLSRVLIAVSIHGNGDGIGSINGLHKHDLRPYESLNLIMVPVKEIDVIIATTEKIGFHGMGVLWRAEDEDEYAIMASKSSITEGGSYNKVFDTDSYTRVSPTTATTDDIIASGVNNDFALYKLTITAAAAGIVDIFWTDADDSGIVFIGRYNFAAAGTFVLDCPEWMRNPNRQGGKLRYTTATAINWTIDVIGHLVEAGQ